MNLLLTFTDNVSLQTWFKSGIIFREISSYKKLLEKNVNIHFLTYGSKKDQTYSNLLGDIKVIPCSSLIKSRIPKFQFFKTLLIPIKLKKLFRNIDIIKTNQLNGSWVASIAKLLFKNKLIIRGGYEWLSRHIILSKIDGLKNYIKYLLKYFWIYLIEFLAYKLADGIILTNTADISFITKCFKLKKKQKKNRIIHLYNFIDEDLFKPLNILKKDKHVLFIGRLLEQKNLRNLFDAFKNLNGFSLDIIGEGPCEFQLKQKAKEYGINVNFLGTYPNNKIPEIINQYEIFILPSYWEGNPKALLEAMSCGTACIGSDILGIKNIIIHKKNGYLCGTSSESIKNAIQDLYEDENLRKKISKNARKFIIENCTVKSIVEKEFQFYKELLKLN